MVLEKIKDMLHREPSQIDAMEAFNLWDILNSKYHEVERLQILQHFTHDTDLKIIIKYYIQVHNENIAVLKKEISRYQINAPYPNREIGPPPCNIEMYTDEFIAGEVLICIQEHIENLLRFLRTSMTNDSLRSIVSKIARQTIDNEAMIVDYMSLKGWIKMCPRYHNVPASIRENLSAAEAYNLWDHLCIRYDNIQQTRLFLAFVHDLDFKLVLKTGLDTLAAQVRMLEKEIVHFGITAPKKPTDVTVSTNRIDILEDRHIYRIILFGQQGALDMHFVPVKQCTFNARIREIFKKLLIEEIDILSDYIKFGKLKGWINPAPAYVN